MHEPWAEAPAGDTSPLLRRMPSQRRSRERVERMLDCASRLIAEKGSDALRMSEVADLAGVSIGSLYQFFPDKSAIVRTLAERINAAGRACIAEALADVASVDALKAAFAALIDTYYAMFLAEPVMRDIWSATQADGALREMEIFESRANAAILKSALVRIAPTADPERVERSAFLVMALGEATMRLAISVDRSEGDALVETYKGMAADELARAVE